MSIRNKLTLGLGLLVILFFLGSLLFVSTLQRSYRGTLEAHAGLFSSQIRSRIDATILLHRDQLVMVSRTSELQAILDDDTESLGDVEEALATLRRNVIDYYELQYGTRLFTSVEIFDISGKRLAGTSQAEAGSPNNARWWALTKERGVSVDHVSSESEGERVTLRLSILVRDRENEPVGILTGRINFLVLVRSADLYASPFESTVLTVVSDEGRLLYRSTPFVLYEDLSGEPFVRSMEDESGVFTTTSGGSGRLHAYSTLGVETAQFNEPWRFVVSYSLEEALEGVVAARRQLMISVAIVLIVSVAVTFWVYRSIRRPLDLLAHAVTRVGSRELDYRTRTSGSDEVSMVIRQFDLMREKLQYFYNDMAREAEEQRKQRAEAEAIAGTDELTRLFNRRAFFEFLEHRISEGAVASPGVAVIYFDLNGFKPINDTHGHQMGDYVLQTIGRRLIDLTRVGDFAARVGGDEFAVVLTSFSVKTDAEEAAWRLITAVSDGIEREGVDLTVGASAGISFYPTHGASAEELVERADRAMYRAKRSLGEERSAGRGSALLVYDPTVDDRSS